MRSIPPPTHGRWLRTRRLTVIPGDAQKQDYIPDIRMPVGEDFFYVQPECRGLPKSSTSLPKMIHISRADENHELSRAHYSEHYVHVSVLILLAGEINSSGGQPRLVSHKRRARHNTPS